MRSRSIFLLAVYLTWGSTFAVAQAVARQGIAEAPSPVPGIVNFKSPMILELSVPHLSDLAMVQVNGMINLPSVEKFVCDKDVTILDMTISKEVKKPNKNRTVDFEIGGLVKVAPSFDRAVDLGFRLLKGQIILAKETLRNLKTSEKRTTPFRVALSILQEQIIPATTPDDRIVLEITVTVRDDS